MDRLSRFFCFVFSGFNNFVKSTGGFLHGAVPSRETLSVSAWAECERVSVCVGKCVCKEIARMWTCKCVQVSECESDPVRTDLV